MKLLEKGLASHFVYIDVSVHSTKMLDHSGSLGEEVSNTGILKTFPTSAFSALLCSLQRSFRKRDSFLFLSDCMFRHVVNIYEEHLLDPVFLGN